MKEFYPLVKEAHLKKTLKIAEEYIDIPTEDLLHHKLSKKYEKRRKETHSVL